VVFRTAVAEAVTEGSGVAEDILSVALGGGGNLHVAPWRVVRWNFFAANLGAMKKGPASLTVCVRWLDETELGSWLVEFGRLLEESAKRVGSATLSFLLSWRERSSPILR